MTNNYEKDVLFLYKSGFLNKYMFDKIIHSVKNGMNDDIANKTIEHAKLASSIGICSDQDLRDFLYLERFVNNFCNDNSINKSAATDLLDFMYSKKNTFDFKNNLDSIILANKWIDFYKKSYPNIAGKQNREKTQDLDKWIQTLKNIYSAMHNNQFKRSEAIEHFTNNWDSDEKQKFINWLKYYEGGNTEKYKVVNSNFKKQADIGIPIPSGWIDRSNQYPSFSTHKPTEIQKTKRELELERAMDLKIKMRSRLLSLKKLLDKYNDILPKQNIEKIFDELFSLEKSISKLDVYATIQDCVIRTGHKIRKLGCSEGADFIIKFAENPPPMNDPVLQSIPDAPSNKPDLAVKPAVSINNIIDRLEGISKILKSRDTIRDLASIDILLNELGLASYFPELTDAQSKLIESFGYASNKVESIVAKLRGSGKSVAPKPSPQQIKAPEIPQSPMSEVKPPEKIQTEEALTKPIGDIKKEPPKGI